MKELQLLPYLTFDGTCFEAMDFYKKVFGGDLSVMYFRDMYEELPEAEIDKVMHAELSNGDMSLMASDTVPGAQTTFGDNVRITVTGTDVEKLASFFTALSVGGQIIMKFEKQVWGQELGMLTDKFGTYWMISVRAN